MEEKEIEKIMMHDGKKISHHIIEKHDHLRPTKHCAKCREKLLK